MVVKIIIVAVASFLIAILAGVVGGFFTSFRIAAIAFFVVLLAGILVVTRR